MNSEIPVIGPEEKFYGYITGLGLENWHEAPDGPLPRRLYATFEYSDKTELWIVPDDELFKILAGHLTDMAWHYKNADDYGYSKLWISKKNGVWDVSLP